jgi:hypothetical protein
MEAFDVCRLMDRQGMPSLSTIYRLEKGIAIDEVVARTLFHVVNRVHKEKMNSTLDITKEIKVVS